MKPKPQCPECGDTLEVVEATPCWECGRDEDRLEVLRHDRAEGYVHDSIEYFVYRFPHGVEFTLCTRCAVDIGSYLPEFWSEQLTRRIGFEQLDVLQQLHRPSLAKTQWCNTCHVSLAFIEARQTLRARIEST